MRKIFFVACICLFTYSTAQSQPTDSILQKIAVEKNEDKKVDLIFSIYAPGFDTDPNLIIKTGQALLKQSEVNNDIIQEASAFSFLGQGYRMSGSYTRALEYNQKALVLAEKSGNFSILAMTKNQLGNIYRDREEFDKALQLYQSVSADAEKGVNEMVKTWPLMNIGSIYLSTNKADSALPYLQRAYELSIKVNKFDLPYILWNLGGVHSKMGNAALAVTYYNMAVQKAIEGHTLRQLIFAYIGLAEHFKNMNQPDSSSFYAKKAVAAVQNTAFFYMSIKPAKLLADMYDKSNCDSTLKYATIYKIANDSLYSRKANQQIQLMTFEEDLRQRELATEKTKANEERQQNIQYALIAFGIITFIILFLLLSRSFITNTKLIEFLGVIALLIVFEFLNLLLHPFLERITHHSPVLMLLSLVCIAALLVPLHHKLEKWATHKLIGKNKAIRLAAAKKTLRLLSEEKLENGNDQNNQA